MYNIYSCCVQFSLHLLNKINIIVVGDIGYTKEITLGGVYCVATTLLRGKRPSRRTPIIFRIVTITTDFPRGKNTF